MTRARPATARQRLPRVNWRTGGQRRKLALKMANIRLPFELKKRLQISPITPGPKDLEFTETMAAFQTRNCVAL